MSTSLDQYMPQSQERVNQTTINEVVIKFVAPGELKRSLQVLADDRHITLSSMLRLITSEYVKRNKSI